MHPPNTGGVCRMSDLSELLKLALNFRDAREWAKFHKPKDLALSLMLEAAEVAEHFQWKDEQECLQHIAAHREELGDELADVLYWVLILAHQAGLDLGQAFRDKIAKNEVKYPVDKARGKASKYTQL